MPLPFCYYHYNIFLPGFPENSPAPPIFQLLHIQNSCYPSRKASCVRLILFDLCQNFFKFLHRGHAETLILIKIAKAASPVSTARQPGIRINRQHICAHDARMKPVADGCGQPCPFLPAPCAGYTRQIEEVVTDTRTVQPYLILSVLC